MALTEYVNVNISIASASPTRAGFGTLLVLSNGSQFPTTQVRTYRTFSQVAQDFDSSDFPYQVASAYFAQNPSPEQLKVAMLPTPGSAQTMRISLDYITSGSAVTGSLVSPAGSGSIILANAGASTGQTATNLASAITAIPGVSANATGNVVTLTASNPGEMWHFTSDLDGISIIDTTVDLGYDDQLDNVKGIDGDFYAVCIDNNSAKNIDKVARWAAANEKLAGFSPQVTRPADWGPSLFTNSADHAALLTNNNAILLLTKDNRTNAKEGGWFGRMLPEDPGTATWAFKKLNGIATDRFTATEESTINDHEKSNPVVRGNYYKTESGLPITFPGKCAGGEFIDVQRSRDWLKARIAERLFGLFANAKKVPYTDKGIQMIKAEVSAQLAEAERRSVIDEGWQVSVLPVSEQATADRAARIVRQVNFTARLAGAVHKVNIIGTISV